jgi:predicted PurR-regulated permease PerM
MRIASQTVDESVDKDTESADKTARTLRVEIAPKTIFLVLGVIAGVWLLGQLTTVLTVVIVALVMVGTFEPVVAWFQRRGIQRGRALVLVFVAAALAFTAVLLLMMPPLISQFLALLEDLPKDRQRLLQALHGYAWAKPLETTIKDFPIDDIGARAGKAILGYSTHLLVTIGYGISTLFLAIYLLADPVRSKGFVYAIVPRHHHVKLARILLEFKVIVGGYMRGQLITSLAIAIFAFVLLTALGIDNALAIALFAGVTDVIPFVGGYIASTPVVIAALPHGMTVTLIIVGVMVLYQEFESRILVPRVYHAALRLPPAIVLVALLVGGTLAGIPGALLALPIAAGLQMVARELRVGLPGDASPDDMQKVRDEHASDVYEQLAEGVPAADAGVIADDLASVAKRSENNGAAPSA